MFRSAAGKRSTTDVEVAEQQDPFAALLRRAGQGDQAAFGRLYDGLAPLIHGIVIKVVRDPAQSEEVTQEAFVELWRVAPRFDPSRGTVRAWATTLAHRRAIDRVRSEQSARDRSDRDLQKRPTPSPDVADHVLASIEATRVRKALERLTAVQRQAVELAYFSGHTYREVAALLELPEGTIKTRIRDAMIRLRDELGVAT